MRVDIVTHSIIISSGTFLLQQLSTDKINIEIKTNTTENFRSFGLVNEDYNLSGNPQDGK